jgi:hypothetical protein
LTELLLDLQNGQTVSLSETTLVVAIDDTGHEEFLDPNYRVFGLGGCAFLVRDYQRLIEKPWNYMCAKFFADVPRPLHAASLQNLSPEQLGALRHFFEKFEFFRIAVTASAESVKEIDNSFIEIAGTLLYECICEIGKWAVFERLFIVFEESDRVEMKVIQSLSGRKIKQNSNDIKIDLGLAPKSACIPAMEVADFIIHTAGAQTRSRVSGTKKVRKDFEIIFRNVDNRLVDFREITKIERTDRSS